MSLGISVKNISKSFGLKLVLDDVSLDVEKGELLCLLGPSGCGKSTLLRVIAGLEKPTKGSVFLNSQDATNIPPSKRNFGIVFQSYALFPNLNAFENVAYGLRSKKISQSTVYEIVNNLFKTINLSDRQGSYPSELSGGEQQRIALARALAVSPDFLLLDEPLSALDAKVRGKLRTEICQIQREFNLTTILVTHDQEEALTMADKIVVMDKSKIVQVGTPEEVYEHPVNRFVADFIGYINFFNRDGMEYGIRPEHIIVEKDFANDYIHFRVDKIEFRGSFCRIYGTKISVVDNLSFFADLPFDKLHSLDITEGSEIYAKFPEDKLLKFQ